MSKKITQEEFVSRIKQIFGDYYILDEAVYVNNYTDVYLICPKHGKFHIKPQHLFKGHGCKKCSYEAMRDTLEVFTKKARKVHGDKYTYISYVNSRTPCKILCPIHGEFEQNPSSHLSGCGCQKCDKFQKLTMERFLEKAKEKHGDKYDYSKVDLENKDEKGRVCIICPIHGEFWQKPSNHVFGYGCIQ